jgi:PAS domain S-box-containing protein
LILPANISFTDVMPVAEATFNMNSEIVKKSEANLNAILNHADSGYVLYDSGLRIIAFNALAQEFSHLLYSKKLVEGNHLLSYFPKNRHGALLEITQKVIHGAKICYEAYFKTDDYERWIEVRWLNVKNDNNKNWGFILASKDITEKKLADIKLEKVTSDLLRRNTALEQFANIISHNLRAPVANIISLAKMTGVEYGFEKDQALDFILSSSQALNKVIDDINQILEVRQQIHEVKQKIYFEQLLTDIKTSINYLILKEDVIIKSDFENSPYIFSIRSFLYSIFYNLILNSIKYRREGVKPEICINASTKENKVQITFTDNGKGIDLIKHGAKLFGLYKRFDTTVEGTGLGLFMIKSQIEELGGQISVESEIDRGTTFTVEIPVNTIN